MSLCAQCGFRIKGEELMDPMEPQHYITRICLNCWEGRVEEKLEELIDEITDLHAQVKGPGIKTLIRVAPEIN